MDGIEILSQEPIKEASKWVEIAQCVVLIIFLIAVVIAMGCALLYLIDNGIVVLIVIAILGFIMTVLNIVDWATKKPMGRYRYEALIDKSVPIEQVYEKYVVVEKRDKIWVLEDKE